ncbi:SRPBCC family protein [Aliikangiella coralliicola]|uniref:ATPase n=1 Tax=Aliikangiella coralliicola TaxID=2592383 RepID=A0A545TWF0_9GAMM|nr:SRPBCC family protein [Aliikangiella coralliicola]TQV81534.1 ATPase [Aliikangiella coralliicola]
MSRVDVSTEIIIDCPLEKVAHYSANPDNVPDWYVNIQSVEWRTSPPVEIGSQIAFVANFLGRKMAYTYEIVTLTNESLVMRTAEGPFPMETSYTWQAISDSSTRMILRNRGEPSGFSVLMTPLMKLMMRRANQKDLQRLKQVLEVQ